MVFTASERCAASAARSVRYRTLRPKEPGIRYAGDRHEAASAIEQTMTTEGPSAWRGIIDAYRRPSTTRALWQVANTVIPYLLLWALVKPAASISLWLIVPLAVVAGALLVRIFIVFHDCAHGSFFESSRANRVVGFVAGVMTFTPFDHWRWEHGIHHQSAADLDKRGTGDVWTLTVQEYLEASRWKRFSYRLARSPIVLFVVAPLFVFAVRQRWPSPRAGARERRSVHWTNLAIVVLMIALIPVHGVVPYLLMQGIAMGVASGAGVWLFYVQHQFEGVYWERSANWSYAAAALRGSSYYRLPRVLQWFSGNIGFHHIHHLSARIPNYNLQRCHEAHPMFERVRPLTLTDSFRSAALRLWDEETGTLVAFSHLRKREGTGCKGTRCG